MSWWVSLLDQKFAREATLHNLVVEMLRDSDGVVLDTSGLAPAHEATGPRQPGAPDVIVLHNGQMTAIELKSSSGKWSVRQRQWGERWEDEGGHYAVCRTLREVLEVLE